MTERAHGPRRQPSKQQAASPASQPRQQLNIDDALNTLQTMFSTVDREVIHMILIEACGGNMEAAVEGLLQMTGVASQTEANKPVQPNLRSQGRQRQRQMQVQVQVQAQQASLNLAQDFLRPPSYFIAKYNHCLQANIDSNAEQQKTIIEDELFAKAVFEDSLFAADLHANPEWVLEEIMQMQNKNPNQKQSQKQSQNQNQKQNPIMHHNKYEQKYGRNNTVNPISQSRIDPSDMNARRLSFKQRFNNLGNSVKSKVADLAQKLSKHKEETKMSSHDYKSVLTSLDDECLLEDESLVVEDVSESHRGTYAPPIKYVKKPEQSL